ncbi:MAG TPA: Ig-like domain-containing protein, partial [Candidatus Paceibacterota bacterium]|nr:Ig-like domain-containing protein [Candidatus Paceibacterota bacterium]
MQLISTGGFNVNDIQSIKVWYEHNGGNTIFDNGASIDDHLVGSGTTFSPNPVTINLDQVITLIGGNSSVYLYVGVELKSTAATSDVSIGVQVTSLITDKQTLTPPLHGIQKPLDKYRVALTATNIAPVVPPDPEVKQGESVKVLKLVLDPDDPNNSAAVLLESITLHSTGSSDSDLNSGGVVLYEDTNENGTYDTGVDSQITSATLGAVTPAYATLTPATAVTLPPTGKTFFIVVNISLTATVDNVIQLQIDNPSTDITFSDAYADGVSGGDYAYVLPSREYVQEGYLLGITAVPSPNTPLITIKFQDIDMPPVVTSIVPGNNATNVDRTATVVAIFSKPMIVSTVITNFKLFAGATEVPSSVSLAADDVTATLTPSADLEWGMTYTATVYGNGSSGVQDSVDNLFMTANKVWNFSTPPAIHPVVLSTIPMNSVIEVSRTTIVTATFSKDMVAASVQANFKLHDGTSFVGGSVSYDAPTRTATFTQTTPPLEWGTVYTASIDTGAVDTDGLNLEAKYSWTFTTTAAVYPIIVSRNPAHGAIEVDPADPLTATFSKDMDGTTINTTNCLLFKDNNSNNLYDAGDTLIARTATLSSPRVMTIDPSANLDWNTYYTIKVSTAVKDTEGLFLQSDSYWFFMTKVLRYPAVLGYSPADGAVAVARSASITVAFSKDMDDTTVNTSTF